MNLKNLLFKGAANYFQNEATNLGKQGKDLLQDTQDKYLEDNNNTAAVVIAAIAGVAIGAALGILFAPDRGAQTRSNIADSMRDLGSTVADKARQGRDSLSNLTDKAVGAVRSKAQGAGAGAGTTGTVTADASVTPII